MKKITFALWLGCGKWNFNTGDSWNYRSWLWLRILGSTVVTFAIGGVSRKSLNFKVFTIDLILSLWWQHISVISSMKNCRLTVPVSSNIYPHTISTCNHQISVYFRNLFGKVLPETRYFAYIQHYIVIWLEYQWYFWTTIWSGCPSTTEQQWIWGQNSIMLYRV